MNKKLGLAVAGALLAASASANAGITIPAGDWTVDIGGNVNAYTTWAKSSGNATVNAQSGFAVGSGHNTSNGWGNGLLPNFLSVSGKTRQNDLDVAFTISLQPGTGNNVAVSQVGTTGNAGINNRQAFVTFGDASWGSIKVGKDLGVFASDAILSDMTLLGVGALNTGGNTTLGRIGFGYLYADWKPQISYTTPNFNGFQATAGISKAFVVNSYMDGTSVSNSTAANASPAFEGKASYSFAANDITGKVWVSGISQKVAPLAAYGAMDDTTMYAGDIGATVNVAGFSLTGYYYGGKGIGTTGQGSDGFGKIGTASAAARDSDGGYVQATYVLPTKTKVGFSWGQSNLDLDGRETAANNTTLVKEQEMWTVGVYHPITPSLNLVAEYNVMNSRNQANAENKLYAGSLGAILFF